MTNTNKAINIAMIMLGCPKNDVDAEAMLYLLREAGHRIVSDPSEADAIIVNTCGFIKDAKQESVNTLLEMAEYRKSGRCRLLVATGCLTQRYREQLFEAMPEVDLMIGVNEYGNIVSLLDKAGEGGRMLRCGGEHAEPVIPGRVLSSPAGYAYLKIAEGCSNRCAYCAIPDIRGPYRSRPEDEILREAEWLAGQGVPELILVAQDTTRYGMDRGGSLPGLLRKLVRIDGVGRLRLLYCYPELVTDELLELVDGEEKICNYLDIPLQHIDDGMLRRMNRRSSELQIRELIKRIRSRHKIVLRTTFITGFPGEGEEEYRKLLDFVRESRFDNLGVFSFSPEEGTPAHGMKPRVPARTAKSRRHEIMMEQQTVSREILHGYIGKTVSVVCDGTTEAGDLLCRTAGQAPEIDGITAVEGDEAAYSGKTLQVKITEASEYDMRGVRI